LIVAVASGKGGTGKTTVTASLVSVWDGPVLAADLDVEEPNLHLFLRPGMKGQEKAYLEVPVVDESRCTYCCQCADLCQFKAISVLGKTILTFPEMCHGCGGCMAVCPERALFPGARELGDIAWGETKHGGFIMGRLRVGEAMSPPLMRLVKARFQQDVGQSGSDVIIDAPPGVSCPAVTAVMDSDAILLVTEPTPFGLFDLKLAHQAFSPMEKPMGVIVNRSGLGSPAVYDYCRDSGLDVLGQIPYDRAIAEAYARGEIISEVSDALRDLFLQLVRRIRAMTTTGFTAKEASIV